MPAIGIGTGITETSTTQLHDLGLEVEIRASTATAQGNGLQVWVYVQNGDVSSFTAGMLIQRKASTTTKIGAISIQGTLKAPQAYIGVAQHTIAAGSYGWILKKGWGTILTDDTGVTANQSLIAGNNAAGSFDSSATATTAALGFAPTAVGASTTGSAWINIPG